MIHDKTFFSRSHKLIGKQESGLLPPVFIKATTQWSSNLKNMMFRIRKNLEKMSWRIGIFKMSNNNFEKTLPNIYITYFLDFNRLTALFLQNVLIAFSRKLNIFGTRVFCERFREDFMLPFQVQSQLL